MHTKRRQGNTPQTHDQWTDGSNSEKDIPFMRKECSEGTMILIESGDLAEGAEGTFVKYDHVKSFLWCEIDG